MADQQHDNKDDCPEVNQHLGSVPFVIGRDGNRDGWYTSYPFPPPRICGMIRQPSAAPPHRSPNSDGVSSLPHFVWTPPRPLRAITRCKPSIREIYPAPAARGTSPARMPRLVWRPSGGPGWDVGAPGSPQHQTGSSRLVVPLSHVSPVQGWLPERVRISNYAVRPRRAPALRARVRRFVAVSTLMAAWLTSS